MDHNTALLVAGFNGVAYFLSTLIPIWTIDRFVLSLPNLCADTDSLDLVVASSCFLRLQANVHAWLS